MSLTLAQFKAFTTPGKSQIVVDEIRKEGPLMNLLPFTDNGAQMGNKWTYQYTRDTQMATANTRLVNEEYTPANTTAATTVSTDLAIWGGSYTVDRVMKDSPTVGGFVTREETKLIAATVKKANDLIINGDSGTPGQFDGLDVILTGSSTEYSPLVATDLSSLSAIGTNWELFRMNFNKFLRTLNGKPDALLVNSVMFPIITAIAQKSGVYNITVNDLGFSLENWGGIPIIDMGYVSGSDSTPVIPIETRTLTAGSTTNLTDIYAVRFGPDAFHGVAPVDKSQLIKAYEPDFERPGAVHLGEVEMVATVALEATRAAGVYRAIKVA